MVQHERATQKQRTPKFWPSSFLVLKMIVRLGREEEARKGQYDRGRRMMGSEDGRDTHTA